MVPRQVNPEFITGLLVGLVIGVTGTLASIGAQLAAVKTALKDLTRRVVLLEPGGAHFHRRATDDHDA
jgi:hypothetical protein